MRTLSLLLGIFFLYGCAGNQVAEDASTETEGIQTEQVEHQSADHEESIAEQDTKAPEDTLTVDDEQLEEENEGDPNEKFNRAIYGFNQYFDTWVADPLSSGYVWLLPEFATVGVANFFSNMQGINVFLNDFMQGKFRQGSEDTGRFLLNSTVGLAGLFDVATYVGLEKNNEDFDQTLAVWGVPSGDYLVVPFIGPFTYRGIPGAVFDLALNPITWVPFGVLSISAASLGAVNSRANAEGSLKFIDEAALDPYVFTREAFLQWREYLATDGNVEISDDIDYFDDEFDDDDFDEEINGDANLSETESADNTLSKQ